MDHHRWFQSTGDMILFQANRYPMAAFADYQQTYGKEPNSTVGFPDPADSPQRDLRVRPESPCLQSGG
jgi:hypothetical protein